MPQEHVMHAARLANLEGAACALLRECAEEDYEGFVLRAVHTLDGTLLDVTYLRAGREVSGESL